MRKNENKDRREYYKLYHHLRMNDSGYLGQSYRERRREIAREYAKSRSEEQREYRRKYLKSYRALNKERIRDYNKNKRDKTYQGTLIARYSALKVAMKMKGSTKPITFEEYKKLVQSPCYLCGDFIISTSKAGHGLDRVDSSLGYILSNCRPCCGICNRMKRNLTVGDFISRIKKILENYSGNRPL